MTMTWQLKLLLYVILIFAPGFIVSPFVEPEAWGLSPRWWRRGR